MTTIFQVVPNVRMAIYKAAAIIAGNGGPRTAEELFVEIDFGPAASRKEKLQHGFDIGWLVQLPSGDIEATEFARKHFARQESKEQFVGEKAAPQYRGDWRAGSLSRQHIPNRRGPRADAPAIYSATPTFHRG